MASGVASGEVSGFRGGFGAGEASGEALGVAFGVNSRVDYTNRIIYFIGNFIYKYILYKILLYNGTF